MPRFQNEGKQSEKWFWHSFNGGGRGELQLDPILAIRYIDVSRILLGSKICPPGVDRGIGVEDIP